MRKKTTIIIISALLVGLSLLSSCSDPFQSDASVPPTEQTQKPSDDAKMKELEAQVLTLLQNQQISEAERKKEIAALNEKIEQLKKAQSETSQTTEPVEPVDTFKYTLENGKAVITEINPVGESLTVPATIDGYQVSSIGSEALSSTTVKSVIISDGIEKIDWFAFSSCIALSSISIPNSVSSIGYGAFDNTSKSLTIVCSRDSFAHKYAQSYGLTYDIT